MERYMPGESELNVGRNERMISAALGTVLALIGLRRSWKSMLLMGIGGYLVYRGVMGRCKVYEMLRLNTGGAREGGEPVRFLPSGIKVERTITIDRTPAEVYLFWRNLENLPRFMEHLQSVHVTGSKTSHWVARAPLGGIPIEWDAEITDERPNEFIAWSSLPGSTVLSMGNVRFRPAAGNRGTEVHLNLVYAPPGGPIASTAARMLNRITVQGIAQDLRRFKAVMEAGDLAAIEASSPGRRDQPRAGRSAAEKEAEARQPSRQRVPDIVQVASEDSFPASDPPSYSMGMD